MKKMALLFAVASFPIICMGRNTPKADLHTDSVRAVVQRQKVSFVRAPQNIPAPCSVDAPLLGNGSVGVAIGGEPERQSYYLARNDFWRLKSAFNESYPAVVGKVEVEIPALKGATYQLDQNLYQARSDARFIKGDLVVTQSSYVAATDDLLVVKLQSNRNVECSVRLLLPQQSEKMPHTDVQPSFSATESSGMDSRGNQTITRAFDRDVDMPTSVAAALRIDGRVTDGVVELRAGRPCYLICALTSNFKSDNPLQWASDRASKVKIRDIEARHLGWWQQFWEQSYVSVGDPDIERQYYLSLYGMASCSRDSEFPPSIFGTWITRETPYWNGDYHLNYNYIAPFYGLYVSNRIEQAEPYDAPLLAMMPRGHYYSGAIAGNDRGILLPVGIGPKGIETVRENSILRDRTSYAREGNVEAGGLFFGQKSNSSYCVVPMAMHFRHTYDTAYAARVYPFVRGVARFWADYLTPDGDRYVILNDAIHEGTIGTMNPILSLGLSKMVLSLAAEMGEFLGQDASEISRWRTMVPKISDYTYQQRGGKRVFRYTERGTDWWGDNTLGIQHIYPAGDIGPESDPELLDVACNTISVMWRWIDFNGSNSFFPAAVRVGYDADTIWSKLGDYSRHTYPNGFQAGNPHGIENLSTVPNTVGQMLCMSHGGVLRPFGVWPRSRDASFAKLRAEGAFLVSSSIRSGVIPRVEISSLAGRTCTVVNPWPGREVILTSNLHAARSMNGERLTFDTQVGEELTLEPQK